MARIPQEVISETDSHSFSSYEEEEEDEGEIEKRVRFHEDLLEEDEDEDETEEDEDEEDESESETWDEDDGADSSSESSSEETSPLRHETTTDSGPSQSQNTSESDTVDSQEPLLLHHPPVGHVPHEHNSESRHIPVIMRNPGANERAIDARGDHLPEGRREENELQQRRTSGGGGGRNMGDDEFYFVPLNTNPTVLNLAEHGAGVPVEVIEPEKSWKARVWTILMGIAKGVALLFLLYMFVCSLDLLSLGFRLIGGRTAGEIFMKSEILQNPVVGVMIGILATVFVQSSSTSTSIVVSMVAAGFLKVPVAIPIIMGANIGTSITNTIVSFSQAGDREQFRRAFAGATILDMFNWITVIVLLPIEVLTGYLYHLSNAIMRGLLPDKQATSDFQLLSVLTKPFVDLIVQLDDNVMDCWSNPNCTHLQNHSLIRENCTFHQLTIKVRETVPDNFGREVLDKEYIIFQNSPGKCDFLFAGTSLSDAGAGAIILIVSLLALCTCLVCIVKILSSVLQGQVASVIRKILNADIPYVPWITGYLAILVGAVMTFLVQSSSVFTSAITPLIGLGVISVERAYPLTLGANIGTTTTALLASMAVEGPTFFPSMQIALCHFLFNITGILIFYPIPYLRFPIAMAKFLGKTTSKYRWFAILYMVLMFGVLPLITIGLSFGGPIPVIIFCTIAGILLALILIVTLLQRKRPNWLPPRFRTWKWLPLPLRSLQPYDDFFTSFKCCQKLKEKSEGKAGDSCKGEKKAIFQNFEPQVLTRSPSTKRAQVPRESSQLSQLSMADDEV